MTDLDLQKNKLCDCNTEDVLLAKFRADIACIALIKFKNLGLSEADLEEFKAQVPGVIYPWDSKYNSYRINVNRRFNVFPLIIVMASSVVDVTIAFEFAVKNKIPFVMRAGAHSAQGYSLSDGMVIDQSRRNHVHVDSDDLDYHKTNKFFNKYDPERPVKVRVEAGATNGDLVLELNKYNLVVPAGTCPNVCISGLTLGGGVGFLMRKYGLTCDNLIELDIILADGSFVTVDKDHHSDLFWACKGGGGGNFGIVTSFTFGAKFIDKVTIFELIYDLKHLEKVLELWQTWAPSTTERITSEFNIVTPSSLMAKTLHPPNCLFYKPRDLSHISIAGLFLGNKCELNEFVKPFVELSIKPESVEVETVPYIESARHFAGKPHRLPFFKSKSTYVTKHIPKIGIKTIRKFFENPPFDSRLEFQAMGGKIAEINSKATAFPHRDALFWCGFYSYWYNEDLQDYHLNWVRQLWNEFQPYSNHQSYVNFTDADLGDKYMDYYYAKNKKKLVKIKKKYDPKYIFDFPQVIRQLD